MKEGYKLTELGEIPIDWHVKGLEQIVKKDRPIAYGIVQTGKPVLNGVKCVRVVDLDKGTIKTDNLITTSVEISQSYKRTILNEGDLVIALRGKIGEVSKVPAELHQANLTRGVALLAINTNYNSGFFLQQLSSTSYKRVLEKYLNGSALKELAIRVVKKIPVAFPPKLEEQKAIAKALIDMDAITLSLQKIIEKKKNIKKGAMQKLLSGNERLPGFSSDWQVKKIDQIGKCFAGGTPSTFKKEYWNGNVIWLPSGRVQNNILKIIDNEITITELGLRESAAKLINPTSVLIAITGATCGNIGLLKFAAAANQSVVAIEPNAKNDPTFLFYMLHTKRNEILSYQNGSAQGGINVKTVKNFCISIPDYEEQVAIADVFSSMDKELDALGKRLSKYKQLKQGVMQQLLTGKKRLTLKNE